MSKRLAAILDSDLRGLERRADEPLSADVRPRFVARLRQMAIDAATLKAGDSDAAVLSDVIGRATALADRLEGKRPVSASPPPAAASTVAPRAAGNAVAIVQGAASPPAAPPPPPPKVDHSAGWKRAVAAAGGRPVPDVAPATSTAAVGWKKAIAAAMGGNL